MWPLKRTRRQLSLGWRSNLQDISLRETSSVQKNVTICYSLFFNRRNHTQVPAQTRTHTYTHTQACMFMYYLQKEVQDADKDGYFWSGAGAVSEKGGLFFPSLLFILILLYDVWKFYHLMKHPFKAVDQHKNIKLNERNLPQQVEGYSCMLLMDLGI